MQHLALEAIRNRQLLSSGEHEPAAATIVQGGSESLANPFREFAVRVSHPQQGTWPDETAPNLERQAVAVPFRRDPNEDSDSWQTEWQRGVQRAQDLRDAIPAKEIVATILESLGIAGAAAFAVKFLVGQLHPFGRTMAILAWALARELRIPVAVLATSAAFIYLTEGLEVAWDANGDQDDIDRARDLIKTGSLLLSTAAGAQGLFGTDGAALETGGIASDVPALLENPTSDGLLPVDVTQESLGYLTDFIERALRSNAVSLAVRWLTASPLTFAEQTSGETMGASYAMSTPRDSTQATKKPYFGNGTATYTGKVSLPVTVPGKGEVWIRTTPLRQDLCKELIQRKTWARKDMERYLKGLSQPPSILSAQMGYLQVEIRSARIGKDKGSPVTDFGGTIRSDDSRYYFEQGGLRSVTINGVDWWFDLSPEDHQHLMNLVSKTGLRKADINSHAVRRIKTALEHGRLTNDLSAPTKVVGTMSVRVIGASETRDKNIIESYFQFFPETETKKITIEDLLRW